MPVFGLLMLADSPLYRSYVLAPRLWPGLDALQDQILGGTIMELAAVFCSVGLLGWSFWGWLKDDERRADAAHQLRHPS
jgi:putative membrane protein